MGQVEEGNKRLILALMDALMRGDPDEIGRYVDDALEWTLPLDPAHCAMAGAMDKAKFLASVAMLRGMMKGGIKFTIKGITAEGDRVALEAESQGDTAAGPYNNRYHFAFELRNGKVARAREYLDSAYLNSFEARFAALKG